jgi:hypothetical protein
LYKPRVLWLTIRMFDWEIAFVSIDPNLPFEVYPIIRHLKAELFGPGHFVGLGLGLRLKSEFRTRNSDSDSGSDLRNRDFPTP